MKAAPIMFAHRIEPEEEARADFYALLARLYAAPPDAALLAAIATSAELPSEHGAGAGEALALAWRTLIAASSAMDADAAAAEYQDLFVGVGRSEVSLYGTSYVKSMSGSVLSEMRTALARLGLARQISGNIYEDHLAAACETMRLLIGGTDDLKPYSLAQQRQFFEDHVQTWVFDCCAAIIESSIANYYRRVAELTQCFMAVERDSFAIE